MTLVWLIVVPLAAGFAAWSAGRRNPDWSRWICTAALVTDLALVASLWMGFAGISTLSQRGSWFAAIHASWIPSLGIGFDLAMDGLSLLMVTLTVFLGLASVICSWTEIRDRVGFFHFNMMAVLAGIVGVFLATDLILFYVFWEVMLVPMYFLIAIWGHENRTYAAIKFFIFTQAGGLFMLAAIIGLAFVHAGETGQYTFNYFELLGTKLSPGIGMLIMLGFFLAFAVKLPMVPFHTWLPDAHTEAPTAGSVILAGLLLKTGGYGFIRFVLPLFPDAVARFAPYAVALGVIGVIYGAILAFAQTDFKRLVAYTSVSHLGFVLMGVFARNDWALQGAVMQMIAHGLSTGALFIIAGMLQERFHTREFSSMGGLWTAMPRMGGLALFFALASLGLPGMGNFVGEFLVLMGTWQVYPVMVVPASVGLVLAAIYSLCMMKWAFLGPMEDRLPVTDLSAREMVLMVVLAAGIVGLGFYPQPVINAAEQTVKEVRMVGSRAQAPADPQDPRRSRFHQYGYESQDPSPALPVHRKVEFPSLDGGIRGGTLRDDRSDKSRPGIGNTLPNLRNPVLSASAQSIEKRATVPLPEKEGTP